jgi:prophage tail gpP-like protein
VDNVVGLKFNGLQFNDWQQVNIRQSIDDLVTQVQLGFARAGIGNAFPIDINTVVQVLMNDHLISTVRTDSAPRRITENSHTNQFMGRSLGRELVDTQYSATYKNLTVTEIVKRICTLFKVPLTPFASTSLVPDFSMQSESPANAIINAARTANLLIYPTPDGGLMMAEPDNNPPVATLEMGKQIKELLINDDYRQRFSEYLVKSFDYGANTSRKGSVKDDGMNFFRPMHVIADRMGNSLGALQRRAEMERNRRMARAHSLVLTLQGWGHEQSGLWQPWWLNTQVRVVVPEEGIDQVLLISDIESSQDDRSGTLSNLTLVHRNAFVGQPPTAKKKSAAARKARR